MTGRRSKGTAKRNGILQQANARTWEKKRRIQGIIDYTKKNPKTTLGIVVAAGTGLALATNNYISNIEGDQTTYAALGNGSSYSSSMLEGEETSYIPFNEGLNLDLIGGLENLLF